MKKSQITALAFTFLQVASPAFATQFSTEIIFNQDPMLSKSLPVVSVYFDLNNDGKFDSLDDLVLKTKHINEFSKFGQYGIKDFHFTKINYSYDEMMFFTFNFDMKDKSKNKGTQTGNTFLDATNNPIRLGRDDKGFHFQISDKLGWDQFLRSIKAIWSFFSKDPYPSGLSHPHYPVKFYFTPTQSFLDQYDSKIPDPSKHPVMIQNVEGAEVTLDGFKASENLGLNKTLWEKLVPIPYPDLNNLCSDGYSSSCTKFPFNFYFATQSQREQLIGILGQPNHSLYYNTNQSGDWALGFKSTIYTKADAPAPFKALENKVKSIQDTTNVKIVIGNNQNANDESYQWHQLGSNQGIFYPANSIVREIKVTVQK